jgi:hypothetical protein
MVAVAARCSSIARMSRSRARSVAEIPDRRQASLQQRTASQSSAHFARHSIRRPHTAHVFSDGASALDRSRPTVSR